MQIKKKEVQNKIYQGAMEVFKENGYRGATMKEISKKSKVPIGNIYRYYENKEVLFDDIVFELYSTLKYNHIHEDLKKISSDLNQKPRVFLNNYINLATSKPMEFFILFDSSAGTKYENFLEELVEIRWEKYLAHKRKSGVKDENIDEDFIMILMKSAITSIIDICKKYSNNEKLLRYYLIKFDYFFRSDIGDKLKEVSFHTKN
ncbi:MULTISPECIES: TetR/AcrR family transcriptional regulator [Psychrilyobacter]|uniref:TetR family transcriptional regulator n=1 Tax=Psychrilyobacter piezotolerans TaxID=2293438 RepID=A0ABX9KDK0_9FUSO|nr:MULTISPECIES: TetR/AcrR family transcriptional regulator [Psychrilyobacter]MCS5422664.1 TetR/AcrR family transcriptional regulator [Psychrilyobacter sp. S5]NDI79192.1 TetR/AcrR family transcriptional regulator [Psychrilyobacter piezotolerans]RDE58873.1 TetR/AcrR family transcriptional regulator [Psychrilyobacter sp. S5]REI39383.1 TetR family transcriptional regulator [Psychrilyobacter piezotolerans]